jgi:hypothetical protein
MVLGVADHIWTIAELIAAGPEPSDVPPLPRQTPPTTIRRGYTPIQAIRDSGRKNDETALANALPPYCARL